MLMEKIDDYPGFTFSAMPVIKDNGDKAIAACIDGYVNGEIVRITAFHYGNNVSPLKEQLMELLSKKLRR